ncbi:hypothetical protein KQX54_006371 [Cotesia glomerata]|uniref:Uncharacterized protein n=1 Tax=Cotesia glomerata TaxID=32391 RepID=A0AAV7IMX1_COTGL|nr:hypothetical protein KQX54_006371 [Cotesia glomerata]
MLAASITFAVANEPAHTIPDEATSTSTLTTAASILHARLSGGAYSGAGDTFPREKPSSLAQPFLPLFIPPFQSHHQKSMAKFTREESRASAHSLHADVRAVS